MIVPEDEEQVPEDELKSLSQWVLGEMPNWGGMKSWHDADEVTIINSNSSNCSNFSNCYNSLQFMF